VGHQASEERGRLLRWLHRDGRDQAIVDESSDPGAYEAAAAAKTIGWADRIFGPGRYFDIDVRGLEHVPPGRAMVVSNHSGGTTIPDVWGFGYLWYKHFGFDRPLHPLAHEIILSTHATARWFARRGVLRASRKVAVDVLGRWQRDLMVMPGGDVDTWRPYKDRYQVRFGGRTGYAKTAIETQAPIVPVANAGAHETLYVLTDGARLAQKLRLPQLTRASVFPVSLALPWGLTIGPWPHLPVPTKLRYRIGAPIQPPAVEPGQAATDAQVGALDDQVRGAVQDLLHQLRDEERS
jgi:1-acyl-sn-glycerol-3-phosphate acyltransferase